jgi:uncharacterized protein YdiU (UPF0061 family)
VNGTLQALEFDNTFVRELPGDPHPANQRRQVLGACYSRVVPTPVARPRTLAYSPEMAARLGLSRETCESEEFAQVFAGNLVLPGMETYAACYGGHQFGVWAGQLGDGRAISLGEVIGTDGERWELQLKGAGLTPYSRTADGRAVLRSSVREFLCSEAMHHLGVPSTRALSLVATGEDVVRDMFYDGRPAPEPGAVVCRVAPSFLRFGNFEIFAARKDRDRLEALAAYTIRTHFPALGPPSADTYVRWFEEVCRRTLATVVGWMRVGFVHGVLNTDNMSVLGLTIDYGPYGWLEGFDPDWTPNTTDAGGRRYRYGHQPAIALWNLSRFGASLLSLLGDATELQAVLDGAVRELERAERDMWLGKLGLEPGADDEGLLEGLMPLLGRVETDLTIFFRGLPVAVGDARSAQQLDDGTLTAPLADAYYTAEGTSDEHRVATAAWLRRYAARLARAGVPVDVRRARMDALNPKYVLRNYLAQLAIDRLVEGDASFLQELQSVLRAPYAEQPEKQALAAKRPEWARHRAGCSMLSCSS